VIFTTGLQVSAWVHWLSGPTTRYNRWLLENGVGTTCLCCGHAHQMYRESEGKGR